RASSARAHAQAEDAICREAHTARPRSRAEKPRRQWILRRGTRPATADGYGSRSPCFPTQGGASWQKTSAVSRTLEISRASRSSARTRMIRPRRASSRTATSRIAKSAEALVKKNADVLVKKSADAFGLEIGGGSHRESSPVGRGRAQWRAFTSRLP